MYIYHRWIIEQALGIWNIIKHTLPSGYHLKNLILYLIFKENIVEISS